MSTCCRGWPTLRAWRWAPASRSISSRPKPPPPPFAMPPDQRPIPRFVAEPPHDSFPYGRWAEQLGERFLEACGEVETAGDIGRPEQITWFPERTFESRTYVPATASTSEGFE